VLSRPADRPRNATAANGITWADWALSAHISWTLRWLTVGPEWTDANAPTPQHLGRKGDYWEKGFDPNAISRNNHDGLLGDQLPRVHYMDVAVFEALGGEVAWESLPVWG